MVDYKNFERDRYEKDRSELIQKFTEDRDVERKWLDTSLYDYNDRELQVEIMKVTQENNTYLKKIFSRLLEIQYNHPNREDYMNTAKIRRDNRMLNSNNRKFSDETLEKILKKTKK